MLDFFEYLRRLYGCCSFSLPVGLPLLCLRTHSKDSRSSLLTVQLFTRCLFCSRHPTILMSGFVLTSKYMANKSILLVLSCIGDWFVLFLYRSSRWSSLFFVLYVLIGVYFVTNLILAVVYDSFKEQVCIVLISKIKNEFTGLYLICFFFSNSSQSKYLEWIKWREECWRKRLLL